MFALLRSVVFWIRYLLCIDVGVRRTTWSFKHLCYWEAVVIQHSPDAFRITRHANQEIIWMAMCFRLEFADETGRLTNTWFVYVSKPSWKSVAVIGMKLPARCKLSIQRGADERRDKKSPSILPTNADDQTVKRVHTHRSRFHPTCHCALVIFMLVTLMGWVVPRLIQIACLIDNGYPIPSQTIGLTVIYWIASVPSCNVVCPGCID